MVENKSQATTVMTTKDTKLNPGSAGVACCVLRLGSLSCALLLRTAAAALLVGCAARPLGGSDCSVLLLLLLFFSPPLAFLHIDSRSRPPSPSFSFSLLISRANPT